MDIPMMQYLYGIALLDRDKEWFDPREGRLYLERAAEAGLADAQYDLALLLYSGARGMDPDPVMARYWEEKSRV